MSNKYSHLLSPIKIGNVVLKNRMFHTRSSPHFLQGPETFPSDAFISFHANVAKNGAAVVTCLDTEEIQPLKSIIGDFAHQPMFDIYDPGVQNYLSQLADAIHFYNSKASVQIKSEEFYDMMDLGFKKSKFAGYNISNVSRHKPAVGGGSTYVTEKEIPVELMQEMIETFVKKAKLYQSLGFDMVDIYMSYRTSIMACSLAPDINKRTDKYGGSLENRARFALELFQAIKKACGPDFLIEAQISGEEMAGGYTLEDTIAYAKLWEGSVDILQLRAPNAVINHPTGFSSQKKYPMTLRYAQAIKESGVKVVTAPVGGYQDLDLNEEYIATGKTDMIGMARAFFCDPEYGKKAYEGRGEDVSPCIRCNRCHVPSMTGPWFSVCSTNPTVGIAHRVDRMIDAPSVSKKVAIIGGGPAGMKAAIVAAGRGHKVTLYEKNYFLGGLLRHADFSSFKWPLRDFKDYLIRQMDKAGVEVLLSTEATPEMIKSKGYDAVIVAVGSEAIIPDIPGADGDNVWTPISVYGNEKTLGENVVVVGGGEVGVETGMYLAENGHKVTLLEMLDVLASDAVPIHYVEMLRDAYESLENFKYILQARCDSIGADKVTYIDTNGKKHTIKADSVVIAVGMKPKSDLALKFYGSANWFFMIGDCHVVGGMQTCMRSAFATASQL